MEFGSLTHEDFLKVFNTLPKPTNLELLIGSDLTLGRIKGIVEGAGYGLTKSYHLPKLDDKLVSRLGDSNFKAKAQVDSKENFLRLYEQLHKKVSDDSLPFPRIVSIERIHWDIGDVKIHCYDGNLNISYEGNDKKELMKYVTQVLNALEGEDLDISVNITRPV